MTVNNQNKYEGFTEKWHRIENNVHNDFIFKSSEKNAVLVLINFYHTRCPLSNLVSFSHLIALALALS